MPEYRLLTEDGDVADTTTLEDDRAALAWRATRPFETASEGAGRTLTLQKQQDGDWIALGTFGIADAT